MSYLTAIVHPLIIIRLLEHRLFTPLLKKTNSRGTASVSLSISGPSASLMTNNIQNNNQIIQNPNIIALEKITEPISITNEAHSSINQSFDVSQSALKTNQSSALTQSSNSTSKKTSPLSIGNQKYRKCSEGFFGSNDESNRDSGASIRKHSQISMFHRPTEKSYADSVISTDNYESSVDTTTHLNKISPSHQSNNHHSPNQSKSTYLKDLSKKLLKRVNSSHHTSNVNCKNKNLKTNATKSRKNSSTVPNRDSTIENDSEFSMCDSDFIILLYYF